jgi:YNFM family putative membrane transporter
MSVIYAPQPLLADIAVEFGRSPYEGNIVVSATTIGIAVGVFPLAWVSARVGRRRVITIALAIGVLLTALTALGGSWELLVVTRVATGVVAAAYLVSTLAWAAEAVPRSHARLVGALYVAGTTGGGMLGRVIAGTVAEAAGWRAGVLAVDMIVLACAVCGTALITAYERRTTTTPSKLEVDIDDSAVEETAVAEGAVPTAVERPGMPALPPGAALIRLTLCLLALLGTTMFVGVYNATVLRVLEPPFGLGVGLASLLFLTYISGAWSSVQAGLIVDRIGLRATTVAGAAICLLALGVTVFESVWSLLVGLLLLSAGFFIVHAAASSAVPALSPTPTRSSASYTLLYYVGSSVGALLLGLAWELGRWPAVVTVAGGVTVLSLIVAATIPLDRPAQSTLIGADE